MRFPHLIFFLSVIIFGDPDIAKARSKHFSFGVSTGLRTDSLSWNIVGDGIDILSELDFKNILIFQYGIHMNLSTRNFFLECDFKEGKILKGRATDADYAENNRKSISFKSTMDLKNCTRDYAITTGYLFNIISENLNLSPVIGFNNSEHNLTIYNGKMLFPQEQDIFGLNSTYSTKWESFFCGMQGRYILPFDMHLTADLQYHLIDYHAIGDWNLRTDLSHPISFKHSGDGRGIKMAIGFRYIYKNWNIKTIFSSRTFTIGNGRDILYFSKGHVIKNRLNAVSWDSQSADFEIEYHFSFN